jgi:hypothetical protein
VKARRAFAPHLAGWLFADLLIVLFLIALVSIPPTTAESKPAPSLSSSPSRTFAASPSPGVPKKPVLDLKSVNFEVKKLDVKGLIAGQDPAEADLLSKFQAELKSQNAHNRRAGLILAWGTAPDYKHDNRIADRMATKLIAVVAAKVPNFKDVASRSLWAEAPVGSVQVEVFFFEQ